jgi:hypothetical protein
MFGMERTNRDGLIGALVSSNKPIAVNCGLTQNKWRYISKCRPWFDQIVSAERTGKIYSYKSTGQDSVERALIVAHENNTEVFF